MQEEPTVCTSAIVAAWCRVRRSAGATLLAATVVACVWLIGWHHQDADRCGFRGLLVALGFLLGALATLVVATQLAGPVTSTGSRWSPLRRASAEAVVLVACMAVVPLGGLVVLQVVSVTLGTSWVQPFTSWGCCSAHRDARWLAVAALWVWLLAPCTYCLAAWSRGRRHGRWGTLGVALAVVPFVVSASWDRVVEPLLADCRLPPGWFVVPAIGLLGGVTTRVIHRGG